MWANGLEILEVMQNHDMTISQELGYKKRNSADWHIVGVGQN